MIVMGVDFVILDKIFNISLSEYSSVKCANRTWIGVMMQVRYLL